MLNRIFPQIKVLLALLVFAFLPVLMWGGTAQAGHLLQVTDSEASRLINYWDLRDRQTIFQVTNTSTAPVRVHIQIFDYTQNCFEFDFFDDFTPFDTHVYDVSSLTRNNGVPLNEPDLSNGHGIIGVSVVNGSGNFTDTLALTGNFRISSENFEYRTNSVGLDSDSNDGDDLVFNFNSIDQSTFADIVIVGVNNDSVGISLDTSFTVDPPIKFDLSENPISCPELVIDCTLNPEINYGINQAIVNSRGAPSLCLGTDLNGWMFLDIDAGDHGFAFIGLNNGDSTGSMDITLTSDEDAVSSLEQN